MSSLYAQECSIEMNVGSKDQKGLTLIPSSLTVNQTLDMTLFFITDYVLARARSPKEGITMTITMKRKIVSEMMTTYFPSLLLMMITYATTFFKPFFFEAALSVNLTTMLVMTTIFISKMEGLPPTSATKMIDYWLILCQLVPFVQVVLLTAKEFLRKEEQEQNQDFEKDKSQLIKSENEDVDSIIQLGENDDAKPRKAWTILAKNDSSTNLVPILTVMGKFCLNFCTHLRKLRIKI